jgi:tetratricopeptide (TPR) repeat protein
MATIHEAELRHATYYESVLHRANDSYLEGGEGLARALQQFDFDETNIRAGQMWATDHTSRDDAAARLCSDYCYNADSLIYLRLSPRTLLSWREAALLGSQRIGDRYAEAGHLHSLGMALLDLGDIDRMIQLLEQALGIDRETGHREYEAANLGGLGLAYAELGEHKKAIEFYEEALVVYREIGARWGEGIYLSNLGTSYTAIGEPKKAIDIHDQAIAINREVGDRRSEGYALGNLADAYAGLGQHDRAFDLFNQNLTIAREMLDRQSEAYALAGLSRSLWATGSHAAAITNGEAALKILVDLDDTRKAKVRDQLAVWKKEIPPPGAV